MSVARTAAVLATLVCAAMLGACGAGGEEAAVRATVSSYLDALRAGDATRVCALLTRTEIEDLDAAGSCEEVFGGAFELLEEQDVEMPEYELSEVSVDGDRAEVRLVGGSTDETVPLAREDGEWKLAGTTSFSQFHPDDPLGGQ